MNKTLIVVMTVALIVFTSASFAMAACPFHAAASQKAKEAVASDEVINDTCPVMGGKVSNDTPYRVTYKGKTIGFCCAGCVDAFKADTAKYEKKLNSEER